jgi:hypothetical protein
MEHCSLECFVPEYGLSLPDPYHKAAHKTHVSCHNDRRRQRTYRGTLPLLRRFMSMLSFSSRSTLFFPKLATSTLIVEHSTNIGRLNLKPCVDRLQAI